MHDYGIYDTKNNKEIIHLYTQEIYESCSPMYKFRAGNNLKIIKDFNITYQDDGYGLPIYRKNYKTINITMEYLIDIFGFEILEYIDIFTYSKMIYQPPQEQVF